MLSSYNRTEYYKFIRQNGNPYKNNEKVKTRDQILQAFNDFRLDGNVFEDDPINYQEDKTPFRPNQIVNFNIGEKLNESELDYYNKFSNEEDEYRYISELFLSGQHKKPIKGGLADIMIRKDMDLSDDDEINYGEFINKKKMEYTKESENFIGSARQRYFYSVEQDEPAFVKPKSNKQLQKEFREKITKEMSPFNLPPQVQEIQNKIFNLAGNVLVVNPYLKRVQEGKVGQTNLRGEIIEGSMNWGDTFAQGLVDVRFGQEYNKLYNNVLNNTGQKQETAFDALNKLIKQKNEFDSITGSAGDFSNASPITRVWMEGTRVVAPILETALPMLLTKDFKRASSLKNLANVKKNPKLLGKKIQGFQLLNADSAKVKKFKQTLTYGLTVRNIDYWRRQGAGDLKSTLIGDRDIRNISQKELQQIDDLANIIALPYAGIEFMASAIPMKGLGGNWTRALSRKLAKKMGARFIGATAIKAGTTATLNYFGELLEEGFQEVIMDIGKQAGKKLTEEDREILGNQLTIMQALLQTDLIDAGEEGLKAMEQAKYAVALLGGGAFVTDLVSANNEFQAIMQRKDGLIKLKDKEGKQLYTEDEALDLATKELGFFGKKGQKEAIIVKDKRLLEINGVDSKEAEKLIEDKFNAKGKDRKEAYDNFNKALIKAMYKKQFGLTFVNKDEKVNTKTVEEYLKKYESQFDALAEMHTTAELEKNEDARIEYQKMIREQEALIGKTVEIDTFTKIFEDTGLSLTESAELATEFVEARGTKSEEFVRKKILDKLNDFMIKYEGRTGFPYSTIGFLTETDFNNLKNQGVNKKNPVYVRITEYIDTLPNNEKELLKDLPETFLKGVNGDKEAQTQYNQLLSLIRDIDYQKYLQTYNFFDPDFTPPEQVIEEAQIQPLGEVEINNITNGRFDEIVKELAKERNITLEEARKQIIDLFNEQALEQEETAEETEEQKEERINELNNAKNNLAKSLQSVFPEAQIILHKTEAEYNKSSEAPNTEGITIIGADDSLVIHINAEVATPELFVHEGFHASLGALEQLYNNTKGTQDAFEERLKEVFERAKKYLPDDVKDEIDVHLSRYGEAEYKSEEALAKLVEIIAKNYQALPNSEKNLIIKLIEELMSLLGIDKYKGSTFNGGFKIKKNMPKSDKQIIDTLNKMAVSLSEGLEIKTSDLDVFRPDIENLTKADMISRAKELGVEGADTKAFARKSKEEITKAIRKQFGKRKVRASKFTKDDFKREDVNKNTNLKFVEVDVLDRLNTAITMSDRLAGGSYGKEKFFGGVFYPIMTGYVWAASTKDKAQLIIDQLKLQEDENGNTADGFYYLTPVVMGEDSHLSNLSSFRAVLLHFQTAINQGELTLKRFQDEVNNAFTNNKSLQPEDGLDDFIKKISNSVNKPTVQEAVTAFALEASKLSFKKRKTFIKTLLGMGTKTKTKFPTIGNFDYMAKLLADPDLDRVAKGEIINVIKIKSLPKIVETDTKSDFYHDSYAFHLEVPANEKVEVLMLNETLDVTQVIPRFEGTDPDGNKVSYDVNEYFERQKKLGTSLLKYKGSAIQKKLIESNFSAPFIIKDRVTLPEFKEQQYERKPEIVGLAKQLAKGEITAEQYAEQVKILDPFDDYDKLPDRFDEAVTKSAMREAGKPAKDIRKIGIRNAEVTEGGEGKAVNIKNGDQISARLDIPTYKKTGIHVVTIHEGSKERKSTGKAISYTPSIKLKNVLFKSQSHFTAYEIATGKKKSPISRIEGDYVESTDEKNYANAQIALRIMAAKKYSYEEYSKIYPRSTRQSPQTHKKKYKEFKDSKKNWSQVGFNPFRFGYFWDRKTGEPVISADEVIQIGNVVVVLNAKKTKPSDKEFVLIEGTESNLQKLLDKAEGLGITEPKKRTFSKKKLSENEQKILAEFIEAIKESRIADPSILAQRASPESITKRDLDLTLQGFNRFNPNNEEQQIFANDVMAVQKTYDYQGTSIYVKNQFTKLEQGNKLLYNQLDIVKIGLHKSRLENMLNDLDAQILEETKKGNIIAVDQLQEKADFLLIDLDSTIAVARALNKASGTTLRYIGLTKSNIKYYSLSSVLTRAQRNLGDQKLTTEDRKFIKDVTTDLARLEKEVDGLTEGETKLRTADLEANAKRYVKIIRGKLKLTESGKRKKNEILKDIRDNKKALRELGLLVKEDVTIRPSIRDDLNITPEIKKAILDLSRDYIALGETTLEGLVKKLTVDLPQFGRTDILNILGNRTESTVKKEINTLKEMLVELRKQARLTAVLEDLLINIQDNPKKRKPDSEEVARLKKEIKIAKSEKAIYENEQLYNTIAIIEAHINEFTSGKSNDKSAEERLQSALDRLRELNRLIRTEEKIQQLDEMLKMQPSIAIDIIEDRKRKPKEIESKELERKLIELSAKKAELNNRLYNYQLRRNKGSFLAREIVGIPRALLATADMSYALRQGLIVSIANPKLAAKTFGQAFQAFFSEDKARLIDERIKRSDMQPIRDQYGLYLSSMDGALDAREEVFMTNFLKKFDIIPNFGGIVSASERNMVTGLNLLRTGLFDDFVNKHPDAPPEALEAYANYINVCTGRGSLKQFSGAAEALSYAFFSPRFAVSRVQAPFTAAAIVVGNKGEYAGLRKEVARQWFFLIGTGLAIINLAILAGAEGEDDPEDTDFGKIQLGSQRWDIFGGLVQPARIMALAVKSVYAGFNEDVEVDKDAYRELTKFIEYKFNPVVNITRELITQKDSFTGQDIDFTNPEDLKEQALSTFMPIVVQTFFDAAEEDLNAVETGMSVVPEIFGVSSGIYSNY